jgi:hypothetical protein
MNIILVTNFIFIGKIHVSKTYIDEGMTPRVLDIGLPATAQEQDGHSKPKTN